MSSPEPVFVSYARSDELQVVHLAERLERRGVVLWRDREKLLGGENFGEAIANAIAGSSAVLLMCSETSMASRNVQQEVRLAWDYAIPCIPVIIDGAWNGRYPSQLQYWLQGIQWVELPAADEGRQLEAVLAALAAAGTRARPGVVLNTKHPRPGSRFESLALAASFTNRMWPVRIDPMNAYGICDRSSFRGLSRKAHQWSHRFRPGDYIRLLLEPHEPGYLTIIERSSSGEVACLCPSELVPQETISTELTPIPALDRKQSAFLISGPTGREHVFAVVTQQRLPLPAVADLKAPPALLGEHDLDTLASTLKALPSHTWSAYSTYFDIAAD